MSDDKLKNDRNIRPLDIKRRFIAGAVCPACGRMDKLVVYRSGVSQCRECVRCGFREARPASSTDKSWLSSKVEDKRQVATRAVRFIDVSGSSNDRDES